MLTFRTLALGQNRWVFTDADEPKSQSVEVDSTEREVALVEGTKTVVCDARKSTKMRAKTRGSEGRL